VGQVAKPVALGLAAKATTWGDRGTRRCSRRPSPAAR